MQRHDVNPDRINLFDAVKALAFMGDLSMGQPVDHSARVAWLASSLARAMALDAESCADVVQVALLRWSGCTGNASFVAETIDDDVDGRAAMLALQLEKINVLVPPGLLASRVSEISSIHCEVSSLIANILGLRAPVAASLACAFEAWDGTGQPNGLQGDEIPQSALLVSLAGDLEVLARVYGLPQALALIKDRSGKSYPHDWVTMLCEHAQGWINALEEDAALMAPMAHVAGREQAPQTDLMLVGHVIDLKLPWLTGHSRAVAQVSDSITAALGLPEAARSRLRRAALIHGLGRVAIPNAIWERRGPLTAADWEKVRLSPYWTARAATQIKGLQDEAELASQVHERLDGSGYFRGTRHANTSLECRVLPVATTWVALQARRPWRDALPVQAATDHLQRQVALGRFDQRVVDAAVDLAATGPNSSRRGAAALLSAREIDVLRCISHGESNKEAAHHLGISPSTVRTHVESVFRKLDCKSRAAATLKASLTGLL